MLESTTAYDQQNTAKTSENEEILNCSTTLHFCLPFPFLTVVSFLQYTVDLKCLKIRIVCWGNYNGLKNLLDFVSTEHCG